MILEILIWIPICIVIMSFVEYIPHRWLMHRKNKIFQEIYKEHALLHHRKYYKVFDYEPDSEGKYLNLHLSFLTGLIVVFPICLILALISWVAPFIMLIVMLIHHYLWNTIHEEMHVPKQRFFSKWAVYKYLRRYHELHHRYTGKNFNVVIPLVDFILGTHITKGNNVKNN